MGTRAAAVACLVVMGACVQAAQAAATPRVSADQEIVTLFSTRAVRAQAVVHDQPVAVLATRRPITGERTTLPVLAQKIDDHGRAWLRVRLPGRVLRSKPPPRTGWISASNTLISTTAWHIVVVLNARRLFVYRDGRRLRSYPAIVGGPFTPTPTGEYFVEENVRLPADQPGAPFALASSDRSNVLQEFDGGPGQIAIHGVDNLPGRLGTAASHGCVRLADSAISWLAARVGPGVPITIT